MYKVFFYDRIIFLIRDIEKYFIDNNGLFFHYQTQSDLEFLINWFENNTHCKKIYIFSEDINGMENSFRSCFTFINAAGGLVINRKGEFLAIKRLDRWDLPKGKAGQDEDNRSTALREVSEETGISAPEIVKTLQPTYHTYRINKERALKRTQWYEMLYNGDEVLVPQKDEDITEARWMSTADISEFTSNTYPSIVDVLVEAGID